MISLPGSYFIGKHTYETKCWAPPPFPNAGADMFLCYTFSTNLDGSHTGTGTGMWSVVFGGGAIASPTDSSTNINGLMADTNLVTWTVTEGPCVLIDTVLIFVTVRTGVPVVGAHPIICIGDTAPLLGNVPPANVISNWAQPNALGQIDDSSASNTFISGLPLGSWPVFYTFQENN